MPSKVESVKSVKRCLVSKPNPDECDGIRLLEKTDSSEFPRLSVIPGSDTGSQDPDLG